MKTNVLVALLLLFFQSINAQDLTLKIPTAHTAWINSFDISHNGKYVATCAYDNSIKIWDYYTKKELRLLNGHQDIVNTVRFSPNDSLLASGDGKGIVKIWRVSTGECVYSTDTLFRTSVNDLCFSRDGRLLAGCSNQIINVFDLYKKKEITIFELSGRGQKIAFFPDASKLASTDSDSMFSVWSLKDSTAFIEQESFYYNHGDINDFFLSKDGRYSFAAVNTTINNIRMHKMGANDSIRFNGHTTPAMAVCPGETDDVFYSMAQVKDPQKAGEGIEIKKWSIPLQKCIDSFVYDLGYPSSVNYLLRLSPGNELLVNDVSQLFFIKNNPWRIEDKIHSRSILTTGILQKKDSLVFSAEDGIIRFLNSKNNQFTTKNTHARTLGEAVFSADKKTVTLSHTILLKGQSYNSFIVRHLLETGQTDTLANEPDARIDSSPGVTISTDGSALGYKIVPIENGERRSDEALFKIFDLPSLKLRYQDTALFIGDLKFLPDAKSYVLLGNSNKLFFYKDSTIHEFVDTVTDKNEMYFKLDVLDSNRVICSGLYGASIWNLAQGKLEKKIKAYSFSGVVNMAFTPNKEKLLLSSADSMKLYDLATTQLLQTFTAPMGWATPTTFTNDGKSIITASADNAIRYWDVATGKEKFKIIFIDTTDFIIITPDKYYQSTPGAVKLLHYAAPDMKVITFEQLDVKYNRPDKVLQAMGSTDTTLINAYRKAYEKRIRKLGIDTTAFTNNIEVPEADFANRDAIHYENTTPQLTLRIKGKDAAYALERFNIWINEVPLFGSNGLSLKHKKRNLFDTTLTVTLSQGVNIIETSVTNSNGMESYHMPLTVSCKPATAQPERLHFVGIGIDRFRDSRHNLNYSVKDVRDLALKLKEKYGTAIRIDTLFNESVTTANITQLKKKLMKTAVDDKVIVSYSGHGLLSKQYDYYLSTYQVDFNNPEKGGLPYEELEALLDGIPARKKLMLIDACHSGEVDKEELQKIAQVNREAETTSGAKGGTPLVLDTKKTGIKNSFELMQQLFVNVGRSTGATIISAAGGTQFALERGDLKNGVFTYSILEYMNTHASATVSELKNYVNRRVPELTKGAQVPTTRTETRQVEWRLW
jgi:WD40 repeat protein